MVWKPELGSLVDRYERREDAIHVAVAPVTAATRLKPGQHVGLVRPDSKELVGPSQDNLGIVDPFLKEDVLEGERFWLLFYPGTVTDIRHIWSHPAFTAAAAAARKAL